MQINQSFADFKKKHLKNHQILLKLTAARNITKLKTYINFF